MGPTKDGAPLWWKVAGRNKRSVTLDLRGAAGQEVATELVGWADVVITNVRYDTLQRWGLGWERLHGLFPRLVMLQISGHGATTTLRNAPGFGKVGEAMSGVVALTGFPDGPPVHTGFSHADSVTALMGAFAITSVLTRRHEPDFAGELIDLALFESLFRLVEWQVVVHDQLGVVPVRAGNQLYVAPGAVINSYRTKDDRWLTVTSATPKSVRNIADLLGEPSEDYATVEAQHANAARLDDGLRVWIADRTVDECMEAMNGAEVVASPVYDMDDIVADPTYREREDLITVDDPDLGPLRMQGVVPKLLHRPGVGVARRCLARRGQRAGVHRLPRDEPRALRRPRGRRDDLSPPWPTSDLPPAPASAPSSSCPATGATGWRRPSRAPRTPS